MTREVSHVTVASARGKQTFSHPYQYWMYTGIIALLIRLRIYENRVTLHILLQKAGKHYLLDKVFLPSLKIVF